MPREKIKAPPSMIKMFFICFFIVTASDFPSAHRLQPRSRRFSKKCRPRRAERRVPRSSDDRNPRSFCLPGAFNPALLYIPRAAEAIRSDLFSRGNWGTMEKKSEGCSCGWKDLERVAAGCGCLYPPISRGIFQAAFHAGTHGRRGGRTGPRGESPIRGKAEETR